MGIQQQLEMKVLSTIIPTTNSSSFCGFNAVITAWDAINLVGVYFLTHVCY